MWKMWYQNSKALQWKENLIEFWQKMSDIELQLGHSNIDDVALKKIEKYYGKKTKNITEEEKEKYKALF